MIVNPSTDPQKDPEGGAKNYGLPLTVSTDHPVNQCPAAKSQTQTTSFRICDILNGDFQKSDQDRLISPSSVKDFSPKSSFGERPLYNFLRSKIFN